MRFVRGSKEETVLTIYERIRAGLESDMSVLWLVSGGSNIALEVTIMQKLREQVGDLVRNLIILPMDERYGEPGFPDSNTQQLRDAGFDPGPARWTDVLAQGLPLAQTVAAYAEAITAALAEAQVIIGQFGMGADAHVAGIKPDSPATAPDSPAVVGYEWDDYVRMTMSAESLNQIDVAYVVAYGSDKRPAFDRLLSNAEPYDQLPAKLLYKLPEIYVFNDQLESEG